MCVYVIRCFQSCTWRLQPCGPCPLWNKHQAIKVKSGLTQWILVLNILKWIGYWGCMFQKNRWYRCFPSMIFSIRNLRSSWSKVVQPTRISQSATAFPATLDQKLDCTIRNFFAKKHATMINVDMNKEIILQSIGHTKWYNVLFIMSGCSRL